MCFERQRKWDKNFPNFFRERESLTYARVITLGLNLKGLNLLCTTHHTTYFQQEVGGGRR